MSALGAASVPFVVLHREADISAGVVQSDIDIATVRPPGDVIEEARAALLDVGLRPVINWPYDVAHIASVFLVVAAASNGVQLDITYDPGGDGKLGLRTPHLVRAATQGEAFGRLEPVEQLLFLLRKRHVKDDRVRLAELVTDARAVPTDELQLAASAMFSERVAADVLDLVATFPEVSPPLMPARTRPRQALRYAWRVARPVGYWVAVTGSASREAAVGLDRRFGRLFPASGCAAHPSSPLGVPAWYVRSVAPVRHRAGVFVSHGDAPVGWPKPDLTLAADADVSVLAERVVGHMAESFGSERIR